MDCAYFILCHAPAAVVLQGMCVHEHYAESPLCEIHARKVAALPLSCEPCAHGMTPHDCPITPVSKPATEGITP